MWEAILYRITVCQPIRKPRGFAKPVTPQDHHYLPASYLKHWTGADGKLVYFHWEGPRFLHGRASPKHICKELHLYTMHGAPPEQAADIETKFFAPLIDEPGAQILKAMVGGAKSLTLKQRHEWARYLMALRSRTPEVIKSARELAATSVREALRTAQTEYDAIKPVGAPATMEECIQPWFLENFHLARVIPAVVDHEKTRNSIVNMHWRCFDFSGCAYDLLTSDRALCWYGGPEMSQFLVALPLSPRMGFLATSSDRAWKKIASAPLREIAKQFNESTVANALKYVYAAHGSARRFVETRLRRG